MLGILSVFLFGIFLLRKCSDPKSVAGIDANHDGVRDDLEKLIDENWGSDPKVKSAARQLAKSLQESIVHPDTADERGLFAVDCLFYIVPEKAGEIIDRLQAAAANTYPRVRALVKESARFSGKILIRAKNREEACGFDPLLIK